MRQLRSWATERTIEPMFSTPFASEIRTSDAIRRLQTFRHLHACSGCFRLERSLGGTCTHWKAPPFHGAHPKRKFGSRFSMIRS